MRKYHRIHFSIEYNASFQRPNSHVPNISCIKFLSTHYGILQKGAVLSHQRPEQDVPHAVGKERRQVLNLIYSKNSCFCLPRAAAPRLYMVLCYSCYTEEWSTVCCRNDLFSLSKNPSPTRILWVKVKSKMYDIGE